MYVDYCGVFPQACFSVVKRLPFLCSASLVGLFLALCLTFC